MAVCVVAIGSGVTAASYTVSSLSSYTQRLQEGSVPLRLSETRPTTASGVTTPATVLATVSSATVALYPVHVSIADRPEDALAQGVVLTSDGWVLVAGSGDLLHTRARVGRSAWAVERVVYDSATDLTFVKLHADSLSVVSFGSTLNLGVGDEMVRVDGNTRASRAVVMGEDHGSNIERSSDTPSRVLLVADAVSGSVFFDETGKLLGVSSQDGHVVPVEHVLPVLTSLLKTDRLTRPSLGVTARDLYALVPLVGEGHRVGAYVTAVRAGSPAALAGLRVGDVITECAGESIGRRRLEDVVGSLAADVSTFIHVQRVDGSEDDIQVNIVSK